MEDSPFERQNIPPEESLMIPEEVNEESIMFFLETLGRIAQDFGLENMLATAVQPERPESLDEFIAELEEQIASSDREEAEKEGARNLLRSIVNQMRIILDAVRHS